MATVILFDKYIVVNVFTRPLQGLFITVPTSIVILIAISPIIEWPATNVFLTAMLAGFFLQGAQACYFTAMGYVDEAGDLSAIESTYPILVGIGSIFLGEHLSIIEICGILIVVTSVFALTWNRKICWNKFFFLFIAGDIAFLTLHAITANYALRGIPFLSFYGPYSIAIVVFGLTPFIFNLNERKMLVKNWPEIRKVLPHLNVIEIGNVCALLSATYALSIGHPALVTSVMTTYPALIFIGSYLINKFTEIKGFSKTEKIRRKIICLICISIGLALLTH